MTRMGAEYVKAGTFRRGWREHYHTRRAMWCAEVSARSYALFDLDAGGRKASKGSCGFFGRSVVRGRYSAALVLPLRTGADSWRLKLQSALGAL